MKMILEGQAKEAVFCLILTVEALAVWQLFSGDLINAAIYRPGPAFITHLRITR